MVAKYTASGTACYFVVLSHTHFDEKVILIRIQAVTNIANQPFDSNKMFGDISQNPSWCIKTLMFPTAEHLFYTSWDEILCSSL